MTILTSSSNPKIKLARSLRQRKGRDESGLFIVEGIRHVGEAVAAGQDHTPLEYLLYAPDRLDSDFAHQLIADQQQRGVPCYAVSGAVFETLADKDNPQGLLAVVRQRQWHLTDLSPANFPWAVALVDAQDPGNAGSILRTIDAVGASGLLLLDSGDPDHRSVDLYHPAVVRASMGTMFWYPMVQAGFDEFVRWSKAGGYITYGTSARGSTSYREVTAYPRPCVLLMGSERQGLTPGQAAQCNCLIRLPMCGRTSSLNLAVATGVLLYEMLEK